MHKRIENSENKKSQQQKLSNLLLYEVDKIKNVFKFA